MTSDILCEAMDTPEIREKYDRLVHLHTRRQEIDDRPWDFSQQDFSFNKRFLVSAFRSFAKTAEKLDTVVRLRSRAKARRLNGVLSGPRS